MSSEIHLFIVWSKATEHFDSIKYQILDAALNIKDVQNVFWDQELYSENLSRFYGENLPENSDKLNHIGNGDFFAIIVEDFNPAYEERETTKGKVLVNKNIFDLKVEFRKQTGGGHLIHATNDESESKKDIWLLLGRSLDSYFRAVSWSGGIGVYNKNLLGATGWLSLSELFNTLNYLSNYVVLRNYENILSGQSFLDHADIDLLLEDCAACVDILNAEKIFTEEYRVHYKVKVAGKYVYFDFRFIGDGYYDINFQKEIIKNRVFYKDGFYIPSGQDYFYSLLHHAVFHKPAVSIEYRDKLLECSRLINAKFSGDAIDGIALLSRFYHRHGYVVSRPIDTSVYFKYEYLRFFAETSAFPSDNCLSFLKDIKDKSFMSREIKECFGGTSDSLFFSPSRANFIRPFLPKVKGRVLEIGCGSGTLTRFLGEAGFDVWAIDNNHKNIALAEERTKDLKNVKILLCDLANLLQMSFFDTIIVQGVLKNAEYLCSSVNSYQEIIEFSKSRLINGGSFIFADSSFLSLDKILSAQGVSCIGEGYGSSPYTAKSIKVLMESIFSSSAIEVYFPFPSHVLPMAIIKEEALQYDGFNLTSFLLQSFFQGGGVRIDSPELMLNAFENNEVLEPFLNSYICVVSPEIDTQPIFAFHYSSERLPWFCKENLFRKGNDGYTVISKYLNAPDLNDKSSSVIRHTIEPEKKYIKGQILAYEFTEIVSKDAWSIDHLCGFFERYIRILKRLNVLSLGLISAKYLDATPHNILVDGDDLYLIDQEWVYHKEITIEFLIYRAFNVLISSIKFWGASYDYVLDSKFKLLGEIFKFTGYRLSQKKYDSFINDEANIQAAVTGKPKFYFTRLLADDFFVGERRVSINIVSTQDQLKLMQVDAAAASQEITRLFFESSNKDEKILSLQSSLGEVSAWAQRLNSSVSERDAQIVALNGKLAEVGKWANSLNNDLSLRDSQIVQLNEKLTEVSAWAGNLNTDLSSRDSQIVQLNEKLAEVSAWASNLNNDLSSRDSQIVQLNEKLVEVSAWASNLNNDLSSRDSQIVQLNEKLTEVSAWADNLNKNLSSRDSQIVQLNEKLAEVSAWANCLNNDLSSRDSQIVQLTEKLTEVSVWAGNLNTDLSLCDSQIVQLNEKLAEVSAWANSLNNDLSSRDSQIVQLNEKLTEVSAWAGNLNTDLSSRDSQIVQLNEKLAEVSAWASNLNNDLSSRDSQIVQLNEKLAEVSAWASNLNNDLSSRDSQIVQLNEKLTEVSAWADNLNTNLSSRDLQIIELNEKLAEIGKWASTLNNDIAVRDAQIFELNGNLLKISTWANALDKDVMIRDDSIVELNRKIDEVSIWARALENSLAEKELQVLQLNEEFVEFGAWFDRINEDALIHFTHMRELREKVSTLSENTEKLMISLDEKEAENSGLRGEVLELKQVNNLLSIQLTEYKAVMTSIQDRIVEAEIKNRDLDAAMASAHVTIAQLNECIEKDKAALDLAHLRIEMMTADLQRVSAWAQGIESAPLTYALKKYGLMVARKLFRFMPVSIETKQKIKRLLSREPKALSSDQAVLQLTEKLNASSNVAMLQQNQDLFVFAVIDWHFRIQRPQHIAKGLAKTGRRVFYFSNHFQDANEPGYQIERLDPAFELYQVKLHVTGAPAIYFEPPTEAAQKMLEQSIAIFYADFNVQNTVSILQHAYWYDLSKKLPSNIIAYDCMDHHEGFGNVPEKLIEIEKSMLKESDFVIVTSGWLEEFAKEYNDQIVIVRNAGEYDFFSQVPTDVYKDNSGRKIIGYYGAIAEWMDVDLIRKIATENSDCVVLMVGADTVNAQHTLSDCNNVVFTGEVSYSSLPFYLYAFDVCLLPFKVIPLTLATNPVKVYEYLSAGKPVVCVDLPEVSQFGDLVYKAKNHDDFIQKIKVSLTQKANSVSALKARKKFAEEQTWNHRAKNIDTAINTLKHPKVSVIVLTYNNLELTKACLDSVIKYTNYPNLELIIVDNASTDDTQSYLKEFKAIYPETILCLNDKNLGFSAGNNVGLKVATGDYLVMLNNDTYVTPGWIATLLRHFKYDNGLGILGPVTVNIGNEAKIDLNYSTMEEMQRAARAYTLNNVGKHLYIATTAFFCVMIPRAVFEKVGLMDEQFGRGFFEDDDYCRRVERLGLKAACADDVFIHHHLSASFNKLGSDVKQKLFEENKNYYESKWGAWVPHKYRQLK